MPWNGSGVFNRSNGVNTGTQVWQDDAGAGVKIRADRHDTHDQDIADGMENTVTRDGQNSPSANLPMATYRHTGVGNAVARTDYAAAGQVQDGAFIWCGTAGGTADAITLTPTPAITAYAAGQTFRWIAGASPNTGAATVAISGLTTKALQNDGAALAAGDHAAGKMYEGVYDGTAFQITRVRISGETPGAASTTAAGIVELATTAETETGTDTTRAVTPDALHDMTTLAGAAWFLDEDNMASNSATKTVSQQSVKAYADSVAGTTITAATEQATTSGTSIDFTSIPSGTKRITIMLDQVSTNGTSSYIVQIGDSGGIETSGYVAGASDASSAPASTAGFIVVVTAVAAETYGGCVTLTRMNGSSNKWAMTGVVARTSSGGNGTWGGGTKALSAELDRVRLTTAGGTDTFDSGAVNIVYE